jgi:peptidoglycan/LPS O-acetylase OafA/YrhL
MVFLAPLWRILLLSGDHSAELFNVGMNTRADALLMGCMLGALAVGGFVSPSVKVARVTRWLTVVGMAVLGFLVVDDFWLHDLLSYYGIFTVIGLCAGTFILHLLVSPQGRIAQMLSWKPLVQLGVVSYGVYLWHNPVFHLLKPGPAGWLDLPVQAARLLVMVALVILCYKYVEQPMLRLKEWFAGKVEVVIKPAKIVPAVAGYVGP